MSTFGLEKLEGRQLFSANWTTQSLTGRWDGTETVTEGGIKEVINFDVAILKIDAKEIEAETLPNAAGEVDLFLTGNINKTTGAFKFSTYTDGPTGALDSELVTITGNVAKNDEGQTILTFKEVDQYYINPGLNQEELITEVYNNVLTQISKIP
jgi:hypothetical protein